MDKIIFLQNGMEAVEANYTQFPLEEFNQNPFIQALPPLADKTEIIRQLTVKPVYKKEERDIDSIYRLHMTQRLYQFFQPLPIHLEMYNMVHSLIIQGYLARNPFDKNYNRYINETGKQIINRVYDINSRTNFRTTASCGTLIGFSGMGKTTSLNRILSNIPQVIIHNEYNGNHFNQIQLVWLKLDAPPTSSLKALCLQFFMKVDELLGTNNYKTYVSRNLSVDSMLPLIGQLANNIGLGMLVIDEIQVINRKTDQIMNFFVNLINVGVNLVLIGTPGSYELFRKELRIARRLTGNAEIIYNNMENNAEFKFLLESMWKYQWTKNFTPINDEFLKLFYEETQGISALVVSLFVYSQQEAIKTGKEALDIKLVRKVAKTKFKLMKEMLDAIRSGNPYKIAKYDDIRRIDINGEERVPTDVYVNRGKKGESQKQETSKVSGISKKINETNNTPISKPKKVSEYKKEDLRQFSNQKNSENKNVYELLLENGMVDEMAFWIKSDLE
ncbi:ATP-binding protein [Neobacillus citreus]|uniref:ATP-binding protein n=1 Tax=Neobacillus citreus TaxID=2833578 RepID=A0A942TA13_9BACI|nr:ATP-binding protein [Neobacillus citreus]MCH6265104.1 ATP-binding protein [Neobacillus citreus]